MCVSDTCDTDVRIWITFQSLRPPMCVPGPKEAVLNLHTTVQGPLDLEALSTTCQKVIIGI